MVKEEYNRKEKCGWIGEQLCHKSGNTIERLDYSPTNFDIYFIKNNLRITVTEKQLREIIDMFKIFEKEELKSE